MSLAVIVQLVALAVVVVIGVIVVYVIFEMREVYGDQRDQFLRVISSVEDFQRAQPEFFSTIRRLESDGRALQEIAVHIQTAVEELNTGVAAAHADLRDHMDRQEEKLSSTLERLLETRRPADPPGDAGSHVRIPRDVLDQGGRLRLALLRDWVAANRLAILRRATGASTNPKDLLSGVPAYLQAEAELLGDTILLIGTRGETDRIWRMIWELQTGNTSS